MKFLNLTSYQKSSTYLTKFYVERSVNNTVCALPNLLLEFEPGSTLSLLIFELLLSIYCFLILRKFLFGERHCIILSLTISLIRTSSLFVLHALICVLVVEAVLILTLQRCDSASNSTHDFT